MSPLIGASIAQLLSPTAGEPSTSNDATAAASSGDDAGSPRVRIQQQPAQQTALVPPCILLPSNETSSRRILLQGPAGSGRTSIAMDLAYSSAAKSECECPRRANCHCTSVVVYRKLKRNNHVLNNSTETNIPESDGSGNGNNSDFPLRCYRQEGGRSTETPTTTNPNSGWPHRSHQLKNTTKPWNMSILSRIRIRYVESTRDILEDLLSIAGRTGSQQPSQAIIVDDLDDICQVTNPIRNDLAGRRDLQQNATLSMMQVSKYMVMKR